MKTGIIILLVLFFVGALSISCKKIDTIEPDNLITMVYESMATSTVTPTVTGGMTQIDPPELTLSVSQTVTQSVTVSGTPGD